MCSCLNVAFSSFKVLNFKQKSKKCVQMFAV